MGTINGNKETIVHEQDQFLWGDNEFETGTLTIASGDEATDGTILVRDGTSGKFKVASAIESPVFVLVDRGTYSTAGDYPVRVAISGKFNRARLSLGGNALTAADADALREYGILALSSKNYGSADNE